MCEQVNEPVVCLHPVDHQAHTHTTQGNGGAQTGGESKAKGKADKPKTKQQQIQQGKQQQAEEKQQQQHRTQQTQQQALAKGDTEDSMASAALDAPQGLTALVRVCVVLVWARSHSSPPLTSSFVFDLLTCQSKSQRHVNICTCIHESHTHNLTFTHARA